MTDTPDRLEAIKARFEGRYYSPGEVRKDIEDLIAEVERLRTNLDGRDDFLVGKGLFMEFVDSLPKDRLDSSATPERCESCGGTGIQRNSLGQASGVGPRCEDCKGSGALYVSRPTAPARGNTETKTEISR